MSAAILATARAAVEALEAVAPALPNARARACMAAAVYHAGQALEEAATGESATPEAELAAFTVEAGHEHFMAEAFGKPRREWKEGEL